MQNEADLGGVKQEWFQFRYASLPWDNNPINPRDMPKLSSNNPKLIKYFVAARPFMRDLVPEDDVNTSLQADGFPAAYISPQIPHSGLYSVNQCGNKMQT